MSTSGVIPSEWRAARRVLAIRLDNLGDMLLATPALHAIKQSLPGIALSLLASPVGAQVARLNPDIDEVIVHESPLIDPWCRLPHDSERELRLIATLNEHHFDGAIIFTSFRQSPLPAAYLCYLADIPLRLAASIDGSGSLLTTRHKPGRRDWLPKRCDRSCAQRARAGPSSDRQLAPTGRPPADRGASWL
jgi:ADP-heptose:LPS heptosyltransferase